MINKQTCQQITEIDRIPTVRFSAHLLPKSDENSNVSGKDSNGKGKGDDRKSDSELIVDLNVFGGYENAEEAGRLLSNHGISLQRPLEGADGMRYYNPHYFHLRHSAEEDVAMANMSLNTDAGSAEESNDADQERITSIMNSLSHGNILREHQVDSRIRSILLP